MIRTCSSLNEVNSRKLIDTADSIRILKAGSEIATAPSASRPAAGFFANTAATSSDITDSGRRVPPRKKGRFTAAITSACSTDNVLMPGSRTAEAKPAASFLVRGSESSDFRFGTVRAPAVLASASWTSSDTSVSAASVRPRGFAANAAAISGPISFKEGSDNAAGRWANLFASGTESSFSRPESTRLPRIPAMAWAASGATAVTECSQTVAA